MNIVGKFVDVAGFAAHVAGLQFNGWTPAFVIVHNTSAPSLANYAEWRAHPEKHGQWTPEQWGRNLASYYAGLGWHSGPHAFVTPDGILLFTPFTQHGTHSPAWNSRTWGIETVGEFEREPFTGGVRDNLIATLGILHARTGLNPEDYKFGVRGIHFHKEDPVTTHKTCPGHFVVKPDLISAVVEYMKAAHPGDLMHVPEAVHVVKSAALTEEEMTSVEWAQRGLHALGYLMPSKPGAKYDDGVAGPLTKAAVRAFETKMGLVVDAGIAGPVVRARLKAELAK